MAHRFEKRGELEMGQWKTADHFKVAERRAIWRRRSRCHIQRLSAWKSRAF